MFNFSKKSEQHPENGLHTVFYNGGQKLSETNYKDGIENGKTTWWYKNGQKDVEHTRINGVINGMLTHWHKNGQKASECNYINGKEDGKYTSWHKNGQKASECNYINGKEDGISTSWNKQGRIETVEYYIYGETSEELVFDRETTELEVLKIIEDLIENPRLYKSWRPILLDRAEYLKHKFNKPPTIDQRLDEYKGSVILPNR